MHYKGYNIDMPCLIDSELLANFITKGLSSFIEYDFTK